MTPEEREGLKKTKVLIVGADIGGLMLGNLLQKGGIDFQILEKSKEVKPLGKKVEFVRMMSSTIPSQLTLFFSLQVLQ